MAIHYNLHRFGQDQFAVGRLINGDLPNDDEERWQIVDAPRYHIQRILDEHVRAQESLRECSDSGKPFLLFLRSFSAEHKDTREDGYVSEMLSAHSNIFQGWLSFQLQDNEIPLIRLHGGSDSFLPDRIGEANILTTTSANWKPVAAELVQAASAIVFLVSHMSAGVVEEFDLIRESGRQDCCLIALLDPGRTFSPESEDLKTIRARLSDFPNVFELNPEFVEASSRDLGPNLKRLLEGARTEGSLEEAIAAPFTYLEPEFVDSEDFVTTEQFIWRGLRLLRVMFEDTYWAALKSNDIPFQHFDLSGAWKIAHKLYGLAIATADFKAIREALSYLRLLYIFRNAEYALVLPILAGQYGKLASQIYPDGEPDSEQKFASGPDPLALKNEMKIALNLFEMAENFGRNQDSENAVYLYQAALILALRARDRDDADRQWIVANIARDWAKFQASTAIVWAIANCKLAVKLFRDLAAGDKEKYGSDLAQCLNVLGPMQYQQSEFAAAEASFVEALEVRRALPPESENYSVNVLIALANLASFRVQIGELDAARESYNEVLQLYEERLNSNPIALFYVVRIQCLMAIRLAKAAETKSEGHSFAQRAADNLKLLAELHQQSADELRELVNTALRKTSEEPG